MSIRFNKWKVVRSSVTSGSADAALTATTGKWAMILANHGANFFSAKAPGDKLGIRFRSTLNNNNGTFAVIALNDKDDAFEVCTGKAYAGTQQATEQIAAGTTYHSDKINIETDGAEQWISPVLSTCEDAVADNKRAQLIIKANGALHFLVLLTAVSAGSMAVDMINYNDAID